MSTWSDFRETVGLARGEAPWGVLCTVLVLLLAGWLLQERTFAPDTSELDYSTLCKFIEEGKVDRVVIKGQAVEGDFTEVQTVAGHQTKIFRATAPASDPTFLPLLREKKVRVRVIALGPSLLTRLALGGLPLTLFLGLGFWASHRSANRSARKADDAASTQV